MKIVHLCLYGPVMDGWNYQDNMLSKYHKKMGHEVTIIASKWVWGKNNSLEFFDKSDYLNEDGVKVIRLDTFLNKNVLSKFKQYKNLIPTLEKEKPNILFIHMASYLDTFKIVKYLKKNRNIIVYVDNHNDFSNTARNFVSKNILHKGLWRSCYKALSPYTKKFYGVLPARVDFLIDVYNTPKEKTELLIMGADDEMILKASNEELKRKLKNKYGIKDNEFLIVTGGKIDKFKSQTILLMEAVKNIKNKNIKLIIFGSVSDDLLEQVNNLCDGVKIQYIGWIDAKKSYYFFAISDLVVFPGRHSVFWEQVVAQGIPMLCKYWDGTTHINLDGNVEFLYENSVNEIQKNIIEIMEKKLTL